MFVFEFEAGLSKTEFYEQVAESLKHLIEGQRNWITNFANASSLLHHAMASLDYFKKHPVNWTGFYMKDSSNTDWLSLGPFQGKVACTRIKIGRGVCGSAAASGETQVVPNVHLFPGHIACDSLTNSEIVVPIFRPSTSEDTGNDREVIGVLDLDSLTLETFDETDKEGLETFCRILAQGSDFK